MSLPVVLGMALLFNFELNGGNILEQSLGLKCRLHTTFFEIKVLWANFPSAGFLHASRHISQSCFRKQKNLTPVAPFFDLQLLKLHSTIINTIKFLCYIMINTKFLINHIKLNGMQITMKTLCHLKLSKMSFKNYACYSFTIKHAYYNQTQ